MWIGSKTEETCFFVVLPPQGQIEFLELPFSEEEFICLLRLCIRAHQIVNFLSLSSIGSETLGSPRYSYYRSYEDIRSGMKFIF